MTKSETPGKFSSRPKGYNADWTGLSRAERGLIPEVSAFGLRSLAKLAAKLLVEPQFQPCQGRGSV
jgi:hypothetical protein